MNTKIRVGRWIATLAAVTITVVTLVPAGGNPDVDHSCLFCGMLGGVDAILNVLIFLPLGIGLAIASVRARTAFVTMVAFSIGIEVLQIFFVAGRYGNAGDVVTNTLGGLAGIVLGRHAADVLQPRPAIAAVLASSWLALWLGFQLIVGYSFVPVPVDVPYYGIIRRADPNSGAIFPGRVLSSTLGSQAVTSDEMTNAVRVRSQYSEGDGVVFDATVLAGGVIADRREIVVVAGRAGGIASFEQQSAHLVFGARTGADALRLRALWFRLQRVFRDTVPGAAVDTVRLQARYGRSMVLLRASAGDSSHEERFVHRLSSGWMLLWPFHTYIDGDGRERFASMVFMAFFILPAGYWGRLAHRGISAAAKWRTSIALTVVVLCMTLGLSAVPVAMGLRPAAVWEWIACAAGLGLGAAVAGRAQRRRGELPQPDRQSPPVS